MPSVEVIYGHLNPSVLITVAACTNQAVLIRKQSISYRVQFDAIFQLTGQISVHLACDGLTAVNATEQISLKKVINICCLA